MIWVANLHKYSVLGQKYKLYYQLYLITYEKKISFANGLVVPDSRDGVGGDSNELGFFYSMG